MAEADAYQQKLQQDQQELARRNEELRMLDTNSTEFQTKEVEITQASANLELERRNQVRDLMIREAAFISKRMLRSLRSSGNIARNKVCPWSSAL